MIYLHALLAILVSTFLGFLFLQLLDREKKLGIPEGLGLSYGLGMGIIAIIMTFLALAGISFNIFNILAPFILILILCGIFSKIFLKSKNKFSRINPVHKKMSKVELFFLGAIFFEVVFAFFVSLIKPMESWDAVAHWGMKAKVVYFLNGLPLNLFSKPCVEDIVFTGAYPWLWPFLQNYIHNFIGSFNDFASKILGPFFFTSCLIVFYNVLRDIKLTRLHALIFTFFLASTPHFNAYAGNGYADLILGFYYSVGFLYLYLWFESSNKIYFILSVIFTAIACYVKSEGLLMAAINLMTFLSFILFGKKENRGNAFKAFIFYIFMLALLFLPMFLLKKAICADIPHHAISMKALSGFKFENFSRIQPIMYNYQKLFFGLKHWLIIWVLFIISVLLACKRGILFSKEIKFITIAIMLIFAGHNIAFLICLNMQQILPTTLNRLLLHFLPLVIFFIARVFMLEENNYSNKDKKQQKNRSVIC